MLSNTKKNCRVLSYCILPKKYDMELKKIKS